MNEIHKVFTLNDSLFSNSSFFHKMHFKIAYKECSFL